MVNEALCFVFSSVIDHINTICLICKSYDNRLDTLTKYIFNNVISFFSKDMYENFIILSTFATKSTIS